MNKKIKIGIIYCCYGNAEYIQDCLKPWLLAKREYDILISAVHGQFKEYHDAGIEDKDFQTQDKLIDLFHHGHIHNLYVQNSHGEPECKYETEAQIRDKGLQWLLKQNCDFIWLLDNDERYTLEQINKIINYISKEDNQYTGWFSIPFKNYIFDGSQWIDGFCPPRIFRTFLGSCKIQSIYYDNDFEYINGLGNKIDYKNMPNTSIPKRMLEEGIRHLTWLHINGKSKYEYQMKHFGHCSYKWNYEKNELEFDLDFHKKHNISLPDIHKDEN